MSPPFRLGRGRGLVHTMASAPGTTEEDLCPGLIAEALFLESGATIGNAVEAIKELHKQAQSLVGLSALGLSAREIKMCREMNLDPRVYAERKAQFRMHSAKAPR